jgi:hypothetical protein
MTWEWCGGVAYWMLLPDAQDALLEALERFVVGDEWEVT